MIKIKRFDTAEFNVLKCGESGGYYPDGENAERATLLMQEGVFQDNPKSNWRKSGWTFTEYGKEYYAKFMKKVQNKHGHVWETNWDSYPGGEKTEYSKKPNIFAFSEGYHNGMKCKKCGFEFCMHCTPEFDVPACSRKGETHVR